MTCTVMISFSVVVNDAQFEAGLVAIPPEFASDLMHRGIEFVRILHTKNKNDYAIYYCDTAELDYDGEINYLKFKVKKKALEFYNIEDRYPILNSIIDRKFSINTQSFNPAKTAAWIKRRKTFHPVAYGYSILTRMSALSYAAKLLREQLDSKE